MKANHTATVIVPESEPDPYPYPRWSPHELEVLERWYCVLGPKQCAELWESLTGRLRSFEQLANKTKGDGVNGRLPDDWLELFDEV